MLNAEALSKVFFFLSLNSLIEIGLMVGHLSIEVEEDVKISSLLFV